MRIAIISDGLSPQVIGGMQNYSTQLAIHLAEAGAEVECFYGGASGERDDLLSPLREAGVRLTPVPMPPTGHMPGHYVRELTRWSCAVRDELGKRDGIDWIYVQGLSGLALLERPAPHYPPIAVNMHGLEMFQRAPSLRATAEQLLLRPAARRSVKNADLVFTLGGKLTNILAGIGVATRRIAETSVGIPDEWLAGEARPVNRPRRLLFVGRNERRKGVNELMEAARSLSSTHSFDLELVGPFPPSLPGGIPGVKVHGEIADRKVLMDVIDGCDILVCPSYAEGMPTVILEGMARGLAIVATDVGAVSKLLFTNTGWLAETGDSHSLAMALKKALEAPDEAVYAMKRASIVRVSAFRWADIAASTMQTLTGEKDKA